MKNSYFKTILKSLMEEIAVKYDGKIVQDKYGYTKFENGKWYDKTEESGWKEYSNKCICDMACDLELAIEALQEKEICIIGLSVNNTGII